jgi:hypothetical protein
MRVGALGANLWEFTVGAFWHPMVAPTCVGGKLVGSATYAMTDPDAAACFGATLTATF